MMHEQSGNGSGDGDRDSVQSAAEAERALFIAQMRARFELDQAEAALAE